MHAEANGLFLKLLHEFHLLVGSVPHTYRAVLARGDENLAPHSHINARDRRIPADIRPMKRSENVFNPACAVLDSCDIRQDHAHQLLATGATHQGVIGRHREGQNVTTVSRQSAGVLQSVFFFQIVLPLVGAELSVVRASHKATAMCSHAINRPGLLVGPNTGANVPTELEIFNEHDVSGICADQQVFIRQPKMGNKVGQFSAHGDGGLAQLTFHKAKQAKNRLSNHNDGRRIPRAE
mmetsp:Transcript_9303/g.16038  ORF Transcript_9303/g.16038 Transcript_9303/m.16038 type:complete len:237 (-) Transcript_9303:523-1233(-)